MSVRATSDTNGVMAFAAAGATRLTVALVNEGGGDQSIEVNVGNFEADPKAKLFSNNGGSDLTDAGEFDVANGTVTVSLGGQSIGMLVVTGKNPNELPTGGTGGTGGVGGASGGGNTGGSGMGGNGAGGGGSGGEAGKDGCGCRTAGGGDTELGWMVAGILGVGLVARRRRSAGVRG